MSTIIPQTTKYCRRCNTTKALIDFYQLGTRGGRQKGYANKCKDCEKKKVSLAQGRDYMLLRSYGITSKEYEAIWEAQEGKCAACHRHEQESQEPNISYRRLVVDHCHKTGEVRSLLCGPCNRMFGAMNEDIERIRGLLAYAERWRQ